MNLPEPIEQIIEKGASFWAHLKKVFMAQAWLRNKNPLIFVALGIIVVFLGFEMFGLSPSAVRVLDARVTFKFTAYHDKDQYFISYSLENTKKAKAKAAVRVQLGESSLGGRIFHSIEAQTDNAVLEPLETKAFVLQIDVPKQKNGKERNLDVRAKVKRVSRV